MDMQVDSGIVKAQRKKRAWSQSELAELAGLSPRTVQRIEKSGIASLESVKALAAVFELTPETLQLATNSEVEALSSTPSSPSQDHPSFTLSDQAFQLSLALFIPASMVMLFMLFTKLPNVDWVHSIRLAFFSDNLPNWVALVINLAIALLPIGILSAMAGTGWDLYKQQGASAFIRRLFKRRFSPTLITQSVLAKMRRMALLFKKPVLFSVFLFALTTTAIGLTMEPYQKANLKHFIAKLLSPDDHPS